MFLCTCSAFFFSFHFIPLATMWQWLAQHDDSIEHPKTMYSTHRKFCEMEFAPRAHFTSLSIHALCADHFQTTWLTHTHAALSTHSLPPPPIRRYKLIAKHYFNVNARLLCVCVCAFDPIHFVIRTAQNTHAARYSVCRSHSAVNSCSAHDAINW